MVFPTFFNLSLNFAIRSSWSEPQSALFLIFADCIGIFCLWLQRNNQSDLGTDHLVISRCKDIFCVAGKTIFSWPVCSLEKTMLAFPLIHCVFHSQINPLLQISLDFLLLQSSPYDKKRHLILVLVLEGLVGLNNSTFASSASVVGWRLGLLCDVEWFVLKMNWSHFLVFEIVPKYCILEPFVDYEGYSSFSRGFLPIVVDIMGLWIKFAHSYPS